MGQYQWDAQSSFVLRSVDLNRYVHHAATLFCDLDSYIIMQQNFLFDVTVIDLSFWVL